MTFNCESCNHIFDEDVTPCPNCQLCAECCDCGDLIEADVMEALKAADEIIDQIPGLPETPCPHCNTSAAPRPLTFNAGVARDPGTTRARWKCAACDSVYEVTSKRGHPDRAQVIRPGRIP